MIIAMVEHFYPVWEGDQINNRKAYTSILLLASIAVVSLGSYFVFMSQEDTSKDLKELANYCENADYDMVYLYDGSNDSDILRALDQSREYICLLENGQTYAFDYYERYCYGGVQKENSIVVVDTNQFDFEDEFMILDMNLIKVDEVANRKIYIFD